MGSQMDSTLDENGDPLKPRVETPWDTQQRYLMYMEKAKQLWESFTNGKAEHKKKKYEEEQKELKEKEMQEKKERQKRKAVLQAKIKKEVEERRLRL